MSGSAFNIKKKRITVRNIKQTKTKLGCHVIDNMIFAHAIARCATTSRLFGIGKGIPIQKKLISSQMFRDCAKVTTQVRMTLFLLESSLLFILTTAMKVIALTNCVTWNLYKRLQRVSLAYKEALFHPLLLPQSITLWECTTKWNSGWRLQTFRYFPKIGDGTIAKVVCIFTDLPPAQFDLLLN